MASFRNNRAQHGTQPRRGGLALMILLALLVALVTVGAQLWKDDLVARSAHVEGNSIVETEEILRAAKAPVGSKLEEVDLAAIRARVKKNPLFKDVAVRRDYPDRIVIRVVERIPVAAVAAGRLYTVDASGVVLPPVHSEQVFDLPVITGLPSVQQPVPGRRLSHPTALEALEIVMAARTLRESLYRRISEVHIQTHGDLVLYTADHSVPVLFGRGEVADKLARLEGFWSTVVSGRGAHLLRTLDLRFAGQVVARWDPSTELAVQ